MFPVAVDAVEPAVRPELQPFEMRAHVADIGAARPKQSGNEAPATSRAGKFAAREAPLRRGGVRAQTRLEAAPAAPELSLALRGVCLDHAGSAGGAAWLSVDLQGLVLGANRLSQRDVGNGASAHSLGQGRGGLPPRRYAREAAPADGRLGGLLREPAGDDQEHVVPLRAQQIGIGSKSAIGR